MSDAMNFSVKSKSWNLDRAHREVSDAARWAQQVGCNNVAARLRYASRLIKEELNRINTARGNKP